MNKSKLILNGLISIGAISTSLSVSAEVILPKASPISHVSQRIGVTDVSIEYSSPGVKGRKVFGDLVKFGEVWRTGANMCTTITLSTSAIVAGKEVPKGSYCLFTIPNKDSWTVILNGEGNQPGAFVYDQAKDVARVEVKPEKGESTERLTFSFANFSENEGKLNLNWDNVKLSIPMEFKTADLVNQNIESLNDESTGADYGDAAKYVFQDLGDAERALVLVDKSIAKEETWNNNWIKAQILAKKGMNSEAKILAEKALSLGDETVVFKYFKPSIEKAVKNWS